MTTLTWETAADWDAAQSESGVVHESVANTDHDDDTIVKKGYSAASPTAGTDIPGQLYAYYPGHEDAGTTVYDFSGNNRDATAVGASPNGNGLLGTSGWDLDGTDDRLETPFTQDTIGAPQTITGWCYLRSASYNDGSRSEIWDIHSGEPQNLLGETDGKLQLLDLDNTNINFTSFTADTWWFFGAILRSDGYELYAGSPGNDALASRGNVTGGSTVPDVSEEYWFGNFNDEGSLNNRGWDGYLWNIGVYSDELTSVELQALYDVVATNGTLTTAAKTS